MIKNIEEFAPKLNCLALRDTEILQRRKVPLLISRTLRDVSSRVAELAQLGVRIQPLESARTDPAICRSSPECRTCGRAWAGTFGEIAYDVRAIARESGNLRRAALQRNVRRII